jgi:dTDP-4-dehydrorhamnose reductase
MLGSDVCARLALHGHDAVATGSSDFDIGDITATMAAIGSIRPDLIIHCAAYTDVDGCERDPERAYRINACGAGNVAAAAESVGADIIAISTDFVFDGRKGEPYAEDDATNPLGVYGASKLAGEERVREACRRHKIVRTSWLYGLTGKCFPRSILNAAQTRPEVRVVSDQIGSPTFTPDLADALVELVSIPEVGIFHLAGGGQCSWYELAAETLRLAGREEVKVTPIWSDEWPSPTKRPAFSALRCYRWEKLGQPPLRPWREALGDFVARLAQLPKR